MAPIPLDNQQPVEQAIFASHNNARVQGYQIVARSPGIDDQVARQLVQWSPSHGGMVSEQESATGSCYFQIGNDHLAIGRSLYGTPEYSGRGGLQTVTCYIVTTRTHLYNFGNDAWAMSLLARSEGALRYDPPLPSTLPTLAMPDTWSFGRLATSSLPDLDVELAERTLEQLRRDRRVAVIGSPVPEATLRWLLAKLPPADRLDLTYSIGIQPSVQRPYRLQFLQQADLKIRSELSTDRVVVLKQRQTSDDQQADLLLIEGRR